MSRYVPVLGGAVVGSLAGSVGACVVAYVALVRALKRRGIP